MKEPHTPAVLRTGSPERPTLLVIEETGREIVRRYAFQANDANTWAAIRASLSEFLTGMWTEGRLAGDKALDAFSVACGLGSTMTAADVLNGELIAVMQVAVDHPAEFVTITLHQTMQSAD